MSCSKCNECNEPGCENPAAIKCESCFKDHCRAHMSHNCNDLDAEVDNIENADIGDMNDDI